MQMNSLYCSGSCKACAPVMLFQFEKSLRWGLHSVMLRALNLKINAMLDTKT